jgi:macrolide transport system ATP-binding/permease protein
MNLRPLRGWLVRLVGLFNRKRREREFAEELESHLGLHIEDNIRAGMSPEEARWRAIIKLGGVTLNKELYREQRGLPMLETLFHDLRYGARMLMKQKSVTVIGVLSL